MLTDKDVDQLTTWGSMPVTLRRLYIAQNGRCPYCGRLIEKRRRIMRGEPVRHDLVVPSTDHVRPFLRGRGHALALGNVVLSCAWCNAKKADRQPYACEILFSAITAEIVISMLPSTQLAHYLGPQPKEISHDGTSPDNNGSRSQDRNEDRTAG